MDGNSSRIEILEKLVDKKWNLALDAINEVAELSKQLTLAKLQKRLENAEKNESK